jgi:putative hydrolase of the HAD superfamily
MMIRTVLFDYGGVLAEEGFKAGLFHIARNNGQNPDGLIRTAFSLVYELGFVTGMTRADRFWSALRDQTGIAGEDEELTEAVLSRFVLRPWMLETVRILRENGVLAGILSDQCHWLDELNDRDGFFSSFDFVFNSFHTGRTKKDSGTFAFVLEKIGTTPDQAVFVDDHRAHVERARAQGLNAIFFTNRSEFFEGLRRFFPEINFASAEQFKSQNPSVDNTD